MIGSLIAIKWLVDTEKNKIKIVLHISNTDEHRKKPEFMTIFIIREKILYLVWPFILLTNYLIPSFRFLDTFPDGAEEKNKKKTKQWN